jgi:hypothetical protein
MKLQEAEYVMIRCSSCNEVVKLAKNNGSALWQIRWMEGAEDFLTEHGGCPAEDIQLTIE